MGLERVVAVPHIRVREDGDPLGQGHVVLEGYRLGEINEAIVADEAVIADPKPTESSPVEVEESDGVDHDVDAHPGAKEAEGKGTEGRKEEELEGGVGKTVGNELQGSFPSQLVEGFPHRRQGLR